MKNSLVPEQRVNKLGHVVTKHVRSGAPASGTSASFPVPQIGAKPVKKAKLKPPTPMQKARVVGKKHPLKFTADERLAAALNSSGESVPGPSDVAMFGLFSVVSPENAYAFASVGIEDYEEIPEFLNSNGMSDLLVDRKELMDMAISMRVKPEMMLALSRKYSPDDFDPEVFATAALLTGSKRETPLATGSTTEIYLRDSILTGAVSFDDIKEIGPNYLLKSVQNAEPLHKALRDRHLEGASHSVALIKHVERYGRFYGDFEPALELSEVYGNEFLLGIKGLDGALQVERIYCDLPAEHRRELIAYQNEIMAVEDDHQYGHIDYLNELYERKVPADYVRAAVAIRNQYAPQFGMTEIADAYEAGVPSDIMTAMVTDNGMSIPHIIDAHKEGVSKAIVNGWL